MRALKWFGYVVAASVVLSVVASIGIVVIAAVTIGGALVCIVGLLMGLASIIKGVWESPRPPG